MFVIPMAGLSSRFFKAGYQQPKYQLLLGKQTLFAHALRSFEHYFATDRFLIILRDVYGTAEFVAQQMQLLGVQDYQLVVLDAETAGQAETVALGLQQADVAPDEPVYIFNIDTIRYGYRKPDFVQDASVAGYLEVFEDKGEHWSFIEAGPGQRVLRTTEKDKISDLCSDGLYYFRSVALYQQLFAQSCHQNLRVKNEYYIAPMYNLLIGDDGLVKYELIGLDEIDFCGTPDEYQALQDHGLKQPRN